ncbi:hypothetical protein Tco_0860999 [Tanacetum coccineum]|uniref:Reverse transcriptase Ty1/copia-type domain-containing protein n=1 Tax=Tanacetum coccineum TaxID=301880 RepID=A0ABQ5BJH8_9ASTR
MSSMGELTFFLGLQVKQKPDRIFISQDKYVADILKKFDFWSIRTATTPIESNKPLVKDKDGVDVDVHVYRSMIGSLMYLTTSRPDMMFAVCACARFQVTPKASHLNAVKRIFSDYGRASLDRKSTTGGCQFLGRRLISCQCKKQTIVANSTTRVEYVAAANYCRQNPVAHSRTKHIEIHTDSKVADLLTKGFDVTRFNFLVRKVNSGRLQVNSGRLQVNSGRHKFILLCQINTGQAWILDNYLHNMVAFLKKHTESISFTKIMDFLKGSSLRYAFTHNPTIYDSLVKQFWQTSTVRILASEIPELVASIDNKEYTITEASVRSKLQLADAIGINNLPDAEIYEGLATLEYVIEGKLTFWKKNFTPKWKFLIHNILHCISPKSSGWDQFGSPIATALICLSRDHVPLLPAMLAGAAPDQGEGSAIPASSQPTPDPVPSTSQPTPAPVQSTITQPPIPSAT